MCGRHAARIVTPAHARRWRARQPGSVNLGTVLNTSAGADPPSLSPHVRYDLVIRPLHGSAELSRKGVIDIGHIGPIPSTVSPHVCIDFVNSEFADHLSGATTFDRLAMPEWRRWFLARCGLPTTVRLGGRMRSAAVELRTLLRDLLAGGRLPRDAEMARLNRHLRRVLLQRRATRRGPRIELRSTWRPDGWPAALATVVTSYVELFSQGRRDRVRICANPNCTYMFVDDSRNGRRRWCDPAVCGNLIHVRFFRLRQPSRAIERK